MSKPKCYVVRIDWNEYEPGYVHHSLLGDEAGEHESFTVSLAEALFCTSKKDAKEYLDFARNIMSENEMPGVARVMKVVDTPTSMSVTVQPFNQSEEG